MDMYDFDDDGMFDNSSAPKSNVNNELRQILERYISLRQDVVALQEDQKELDKETKGSGFDVKTIKRLVKYLEIDKVKMAEEDALFQLYKDSTGID